MPSSSDLPQKSLRASSHATAMPNGSATTVATIAIRSDRRIAIHSSGVRSNTRYAGAAQRYDVGLTRKREAVAFEHRSSTACDCRKSSSAVASGFALTVARDRIDDLGMRVGREVRRRSSRRARPWRRSRRRCRARPRRARPASARRARSRPWPSRFSTDAQMPSFSQRGHGVAADRHRLHVAGGDAAVADELGEVEARRERHGCRSSNPSARSAPAGCPGGSRACSG